MYTIIYIKLGPDAHILACAHTYFLMRLKWKDKLSTRYTSGFNFYQGVDSFLYAFVLHREKLQRPVSCHGCISKKTDKCFSLSWVLGLCEHIFKNILWKKCRQTLTFKYQCGRCRTKLLLTYYSAWLTYVARLCCLFTTPNYIIPLSIYHCLDMIVNTF